MKVTDCSLPSYCRKPMSDILTPQQRHANMAAVHSKNTRPEMIVRKWLWSHGYRYRLNHPRLPGKPDIVMRKYRTCIFVNGCFWHGHEGCKYYVYTRQNLSPRPPNQKLSNAGRRAFDGSGRPTGRVWKPIKQGRKLSTPFNLIDFGVQCQ